MCGLDYVYLRSGYRQHESSYGAGIAIERADELDKSIAVSVIFSFARLRGQEVRFLRSLTDLSQTEVANILGVKRITVARWESAPNTPIPGPADRVLRTIAARRLFNTEKTDILETLSDLFSEITDNKPGDIVMSYAPDETGDIGDLFKDGKPKTEGWKKAEAA